MTDGFDSLIGESRRKFLQNMAVAGSAVAVGNGAIGTAAAEPPERTDSEKVDEALDDPKVQSLLKELGSPQVLPEHSATESDNIGQTTIEITYIPTQVGSITYGVHSDGSTEATFAFKNSRNNGLLPDIYQNLPHTDSAILKGLDDGVVFTRLATEQERNAMFDDLEIDPETATAYIDSETEQFFLKYTDEDGTDRTFEISGGSLYTESETSFFGYKEITTDDSGFSILDSRCDEADWCWRCLQSTGACGACYASCSAIGPGCAACILAFCGGSGYACTGCVDCNT